jgi:hypothetical protein
MVCLEPKGIRGGVLGLELLSFDQRSSRALQGSAMITQRRTGSSAPGLHQSIATVIRLSHVPREHRPTRAEIELDTAFRVRLMHVGRASSVTPDEKHVAVLTNDLRGCGGRVR